ncbi:MAG: hypothetical protein PWP40_1393 [Rhodocyclaceae bacterium]|nr:hypothetical protein [Rhodocyclaceae bacterium]
MSIINRSAWVVHVPRKPAHTREFSFTKTDAAQAYCQQLRAAGLDARLTQLENSWQLRLRYAHNSFVQTFDSREEAEKTQKKIEADRALSIFRDYTAAARITVRELMERYRDDRVDDRFAPPLVAAAGQNLRVFRADGSVRRVGILIHPGGLPVCRVSAVTAWIAPKGGRRSPDSVRGVFRPRQRRASKPADSSGPVAAKAAPTVEGARPSAGVRAWFLWEGS